MRKIKKIASMLLALVMLFSMTTTAFAEDVKNTTLTIKTTKNHTYRVYQLLKGDVSELENGSGKLSNVEKGFSLKDTEKTVEEIVEEIVEALKDKTGGELGNAAYAYIDTNKKYAEITGDGEEKNINVAEGYYVVTDEYTNTAEGTDPVSRYLVAVVGPTTMEPKVITEPELDKKIINTDKNKPIDEYGKTDTAAIGDTIEYEVTSKVPNHEGYTYYYYVLDDTLSKGLTLDETSFKVTIGGVELSKGPESPDYYLYVKSNDDGTTSFKLAFADIKKYNLNTEISVKYNATVNENAVIGTDANTNTVKLEYSNNPNISEKKDNQPGLPSSEVPTGVTPDRVTKTYVTELKLLKVDGEGKKLTGAEFTLVGSNLTKIKFTLGDSFVKSEEGTYWKLKDGTYTTDDPNTEGMDQSKYEDTNTKYKKETVVTAQTSDSNEKSVTAFVDENGYIQFTGLDVGEYVLKETVTPEGYNTIADIKFTISATQEGATTMTGGSITWSSDNEHVALNGNTFEITVKNIAGTVLPSTGGIGTTIFYIVGGLLVVAAVALLITKKKMSAEK